MVRRHILVSRQDRDSLNGFALWVSIGAALGLWHVGYSAPKQYSTISIWLGCWASGAAYGPLLPPGTWWAVSVLDERGMRMDAWMAIACLAAYITTGLFFHIRSQIQRKPAPLPPVRNLSSQERT